MNRVRVQLLDAGNHFRSALKRLNKIGGAVEQALARMGVALKDAVAWLNKAETYAKNAIKAAKDAAGLYAKLAKSNRSLIAANKAYCDGAAYRYNRGSAAAKNAIKLFREIRHYFVEHYARIHSFIKAHYGH